MAAQYIYSETPPACNRGNGDDYVCTETVYDDETGNAIASVDPLGRITRTYYDELDRPVLVVRNLTNWDEHYPDPPPINLYGNEENVATETHYDSTGSAIASIDWLVEGGTPISITTRNYYDELSRPITVVQNLSGQSIYDPTAPAYNPDFPDRNVRTETVYDGVGNAIANIEWTADPSGIALGISNENGVIVKHAQRSYYDKINRPWLIVENLDPNHDLTNPDPPTCNRDATG